MNAISLPSADHVAAALANARTHQGLFLLPVWQFLGQRLAWFRTRKALLILTAMFLVGVMLAVIPAEYRVTAEGRLLRDNRNHHSLDHHPHQRGGRRDRGGRCFPSPLDGVEQ